MNRLLLLACAVGVSAGTAYAAPVEGFGNGVPLEMAVQQILPDGYRVTYRGVDRHAKVSWHGGASWQSVLRSIRAGGHPLAVAVSGRQVVLSDADAAYVQPRTPQAAPPQPASPPQVVASNLAQRGLVIVPLRRQEPAPTASTPVPVSAPAVADTAPAAPPEASPPTPVAAPIQPEAKDAAVAPSEARPARLSAREQRAAAAAERAAARAEAAQAAAAPARSQSALVSADSRIWRAPQGKTLDQVLGDWADHAGWTLVFNSRMIYELQSGAEFEGDFVEAASSLVRSVRALPQPMAMIYRGNKTIVVSNRADQAN